MGYKGWNHEYPNNQMDHASMVRGLTRHNAAGNAAPTRQQRGTYAAPTRQ
jgi:hypothetical protein